MLNPKLIIFDLDGVLANTEHFYMKIISDALINQGFSKYTLEYCGTHFIGTAFPLILNIVEKETSKKIDKHAIDRYLNKQCKDFDKHITIIKGAKEFIQELKIPFCVASSSSLEQINKTLGALHLNKFFTSKTTFSAYVLNKFKPDPAVYLEALHKMGFKAQDTIAIEDSIPGVTSASSAGINTIGFVGADYLKHSKQTQAEALLVKGAFIVKDNFEDIKTLLFQS